MTPWLQDPDVTLWHGDCLEVLRELPDRSVHMCATSPPFYGLRDYGAEGQIGLEETPDQWVARLVTVFREVRRVLRDDGTLWVEIGDSYSSQGGVDVNGSSDGAVGRGDRAARRVMATKPKDLLGQPWLLAFALRADGWYLRSEIIWARPNPMPESVTDRPTKSHSTVFLLSKSPRYFYDADAIREEYRTTSMPGQRVNETQHYGAGNGGNTGLTNQLAAVRDRLREQNRPQTETLDGSAGESPRGPDGRRATAVKGQENSEQHRDGERWPNPSGANARSVWNIATEPTPFQHFATWPRKLVARMIQAGTSEKGCCPECGAQWVRETEREGGNWEERKANGLPMRAGFSQAYPVSVGTSSSRTLGWSHSCDCARRVERSPLAPRFAPVPCTVLDPFAGSGTTNLVARHHGRRSVGIELNEQYLKIAADRLAQLSLLAVTE